MVDDEDSARRCTSSEHVLNTDQNLQRGQSDGRFILGAFVVVVIAGPLATAAIDIQSSLAAVPGFSWLSASFIALLIVSVIVAAALGIE
ncbi:hypothetical protein [Haloarcula brevis]|uniref:hypothetical protein n=1 Tax=Haloarcula brevis TaxID=3111453 RepID=UPI00300E9D6E